MNERSNTIVERAIWEDFCRTRKIQGEVSYSDKPDVRLLTRSEVIGVEITSLYLLEGSSIQSEQRQRPLRQIVIDRAFSNYRVGGGKGIEITLQFSIERPIVNSRIPEIADKLVSIAKRIENLPVGSVSSQFFSDVPEIEWIYLNSKQYDDPKWRVGQVYSLQKTAELNVQKVIRQKEAKALSYNGCNQYWLLIAVDPMDAAQEQEFMIGELDISSSFFSKVVLFKRLFGEIREWDAEVI